MQTCTCTLSLIGLDKVNKINTQLDSWLINSSLIYQTSRIATSYNFFYEMISFVQKFCEISNVCYYENCWKEWDRTGVGRHQEDQPYLDSCEMSWYNCGLLE